jgi:hypothetical protein
MADEAFCIVHGMSHSLELRDPDCEFEDGLGARVGPQTPSGANPLRLDPKPWVRDTGARFANPADTPAFTILDPQPGYEQDRTKYEDQR